MAAAQPGHDDFANMPSFVQSKISGAQLGVVRQMCLTATCRCSSFDVNHCRDRAAQDKDEARLIDKVLTLRQRAALFQQIDHFQRRLQARLWCLILVALANLSFAERSARAAAAKEPLRIVSCSLASDETLIALLSAAGKLPRLVGVSSLADDPSWSNLTQVPSSVAGRCGGEPEALFRLHPDLVILASFNRAELKARLEAAGVNTYVLGQFVTLDDILANIDTLARLTHTESVAPQLMSVLRQARALALATPPAFAPSVIEYIPGGTVAGTETLFDALVRAAGGTNAAGVAHIKGWQRLSSEILLTLPVDAVVAAGTPTEKAAMQSQLQNLPGWRELAAVKTGHIIMIPGNELGATSVAVAKALTKLHAAFSATSAVPKALPRPKATPETGASR